MIDPAVQRLPPPSRPIPIVLIGCGGVARHGHLPAYSTLGLDVVGVHDVRHDVAAALAADFKIDEVCRTLRQATRRRDVVFDLAVPADQTAAVLRRLPDGAAVLIQKPLGRNLAEARRILATCRRKRLVAAVNFQLRCAPNMLALHEALRRGMLGDLVDIEVRVNTHTPWNAWSFLEGIPRLEIVYHSIHYLDLLRRLCGEPESVHAVALPHPAHVRHADVRSSIILRYGGGLRASLYTNHSHEHDRTHAMSQLKLEGTAGAAVATMGVNLDYPRGIPDALAIARKHEPWQEVPLRGSWFPTAFEGPMSNLQRVVTGEDDTLISGVEDAARTMALVEACYRSSAKPGTRLPTID